MRDYAVAVLISVGTLTMLPQTIDDPAPMRGFSAEAARAQRAWEEKFKAIPDPARMREAMRYLTARPRHVGAPYTRETAEWMVTQFRSWGWQAEIETFEVLFPTPRERVLELVAPTRFTASLREPAIGIDPSSQQQAEQLPTYNAYSIDGDVTAPLVYVNYGMPADYEELDRRGISVKGAIVIARYGAGWRGIKPKVAAERGAVGAIIYSDPADDGYRAGDVYPDGPMRNRDGVQRGSVADMPTHPGDPLTPGVGATKNAKRLKKEQAATLTKIPVLPISYGDAQPLLAAIGGPLVPEAWRGGLPITYHVGPGPARVHLKLAFDWDIKPVHNVIARLPGAQRPDEWVVRGNHHDAWVNGAEDPISGLVAELEEARAMGELYRQGWRPRRTIVYAAWDGEEPGLLGSTEWVEAHREELQRKAVAYLNTDSNGRGYLDMGGSHTLEQFMNEVAREVQDPETKLTVWKRRQLQLIRAGGEGRKEARERADLRLDALGSGSDFTPFLQHAGVPTLNLGFYGEDDGGIYHSIYDNFRWFTSFSDTSFVYGRALAHTVGLAVMRLAGAEVLPHEFTALAETARRYGGELEKLRDAVADSIAETSRQLEEGAFLATTDPRRPLLEPKREAPPPNLSFAALRNALDSLERSAKRYDAAYRRALGSDRPVAAALADSVNARLLASERALMSTDGLPRRPWFRHLLYAPGYYTGYGVKTMPAAREAIERRQWPDAEAQLARVAKAVTAEAALAADAAAVLERASGTASGAPATAGRPAAGARP